MQELLHQAFSSLAAQGSFAITQDADGAQTLPRLLSSTALLSICLEVELGRMERPPASSPVLQPLSQGFFFALCLLLSSNWLKHSQTSITHFGLEGLPFKRELFLYLLAGKENSPGNEQSTQHSAWNPSESRGTPICSACPVQALLILAKKRLKQNAGFAT